MKNGADIFKITCGVCLALMLCSVGLLDWNTRWQELPPTLPVDVNGGDTKYLGLAVQQSAMSAERRDSQEIGGNQGISIRDPNSAEYTDLTGLWVGYAVIDHVSQFAGANDPREPSPTGSEFQFPLILHADADDNVYLLREIVQLWKNGMDFVKEPGRFVLVTDQSMFSDPNYGGASLRDGQPRGRRISSAAFSFPKPIKMQPVSGSFGYERSIFGLESPIVIAPDDPLNPFRHKFHPDHDDRNESYEVTRDLTLEFIPKSPGSSMTVGWGDTDICGIYTEVLTGLHKLPIQVKGTFRLHRISQIGELDDGR